MDKRLPQTPAASRTAVEVLDGKSEVIRSLAAQVRTTADALDRMIKSTRSGGWSTNNVDAMERERDACYALLGRLGL